MARKGQTEDSDKSRINLNKATAEELQKIPNIGPSEASAIVNYRENHGDFESMDDLKKVPGFGPSRTEAIKDYAEI